MADAPHPEPAPGAGRTPTVPLRVPKTMWAAYKRVTQRLGTNRTTDLIDHIRAQILQHCDAQDLEDLAAADAELAARRDRMHSGRPPKGSAPE